MPSAKKSRGYSQQDLRDVSDNPKLTKADIANAKPFSKIGQRKRCCLLVGRHRVAKGDGDAGLSVTHQSRRFSSASLRRGKTESVT